MMQTADDMSRPSPGAAMLVGLAVVMSLGGTLFGLAGLLMWGMRTFDVVMPEAGEAGGWFGDAAAFATPLNFGLMAIITTFGLLNLLGALRWQEFLSGGWRRWLVQSAVAMLAAILFFGSAAPA